MMNHLAVACLPGLCFNRFALASTETDLLFVHIRWRQWYEQQDQGQIELNLKQLDENKLYWCIDDNDYITTITEEEAMLIIE